MTRDCEVDANSSEILLSHAQELVLTALDKAKQVKGFQVRWKGIVTMLEKLPSRLSELSSHPCFSKNSICREQLEAVSSTLLDAIHLSESCSNEKYKGKLQMQSDLDALSGKLDLILRDCGILIKTGILATLPLKETPHRNIKELLARIQIGYLDSKHRALEALMEATADEENLVLSVLTRNSVAALVHLLAAASPRVREDAITFISSLVQSGKFNQWLVCEGVLPPLIRLIESGTSTGKEKALISLEKLSMSSETARSIVGHGGIRPLIDTCRFGYSACRTASTGTLKNLSCVPEVRQCLADEGIVRVMIELLDRGISSRSKEYASECLQNLTSSNENLRRSVVSEGGVQTLIAYLYGPSPQESTVLALRNLVGSISGEALVSLGLFPRLVHVLKIGPVGAQQAAASAICRVSNTAEIKKLAGESGCIPLLINMLEAGTNGAREVAAQAISTLLIVSQNRRIVKRNKKSVPSLVQLLDPGLHNTAKKYAVCCLGALASSKRCKKLMISYGAIGYLKKLTEMDVPGAKKVQNRLERGNLRNMFGKK